MSMNFYLPPQIKKQLSIFLIIFGLLVIFLPTIIGSLLVLSGIVLQSNYLQGLILNLIKKVTQIGYKK
ncbi:hypothetical protein FJ366_02340 [Candidatus Dependentiae bacterium]|nr:hypothetical protein [Candidatus Dependentiae bacterium]